MIDQGLIPRLLKLIKMAEYNPSALWTLDNVLYNNGTGEARETAVREAQEGGAVNILIDILCAAYNSRSFVFSDRASSSENANAAIHCLRIMVLNDEPSRNHHLKKELYCIVYIPVFFLSLLFLLVHTIIIIVIIVNVHH